MKPIKRLPIFAIEVTLFVTAIVLLCADFVLDLKPLGYVASVLVILGLILDISAGSALRRERDLLQEIRRLRAGLRWYAEQQHMILGGWDEPDEPGWLCPPGSKEDMIEEVENGLPWMVEDGGVARLILRGGRIEKEDGELVARMDPKGRRDENKRTLIPCYKFDFGDTPLILRQTDSVHQFAEVFGADAAARPIPLRIEPITLTKQQFREIPDWG